MTALKETMEKQIKECFDRHRQALGEWREENPIKAWHDSDNNLCIEYESGKWWHYNEKGEWW